MLLIKISGSKLVSMICCSLCEASFRGTWNFQIKRVKEFTSYYTQQFEKSSFVKTFFSFNEKFHFKVKN